MKQRNKTLNRSNKQTDERSVGMIQKAGGRRAGSRRENESATRCPGRSHFQSFPITEALDRPEAILVSRNDPSWLMPKLL